VSVRDVARLCGGLVVAAAMVVGPGAPAGAKGPMGVAITTPGTVEHPDGRSTDLPAIADPDGGDDDRLMRLKRIGPATRAEAVRVGGAVGYWISGAPHEVQVLGSSGEARPDVVRLAGNTLLWTDGATTYRLGSALDREAAVEVAERIPAAGS
jgi:hypothetical protein